MFTGYNDVYIWLNFEKITIQLVLKQNTNHNNYDYSRFSAQVNNSNDYSTKVCKLNQTSRRKLNLAKSEHIRFCKQVF